MKIGDKQQKREDVLRDFFFEMFCQLKAIGSREVIYNDYVTFAVARNMAPMNIRQFEEKLEQTFNRILKGFRS